MDVYENYNTKSIHISRVWGYIQEHDEHLIVCELAHSKNEFVGLTMMSVMWGLLCQQLAFMHLLSCQKCILKCY